MEVNAKVAVVPMPTTSEAIRAKDLITKASTIDLLSISIHRASSSHSINRARAENSNLGVALAQLVTIKAPQVTIIILASTLTKVSGAGSQTGSSQASRSAIWLPLMAPRIIRKMSIAPKLQAKCELRLSKED